MATDIQATGTEKAKPVFTAELLEQLGEARRLLWNNGILAYRESERIKNRLMREYTRRVTATVDTLGNTR